MKLVLNGHDERYVVEQGMLNLFPGERPVYEPIGPGDDSWAVVTLREDDRCHVTVELCFRGKSLPYSLDVPLVGGEFQREGIRRRAIGKCFFLAARALTGHTPPWGMLTGVRPVKLPTRALLSGATPLQAKQELREEYYVSPDRAALAVDCAQASIAAQRSLKEGEVSLYLGIPFCPTRCAYCSFVSADVGRTLTLVEPYVDALLKEIDGTARVLTESGRTIRSFYMGGGTPTTLSARQLDRVLTRCEQVLPLEGCTELTVEAGRPDTINREKLEVLRAHGVGRVSINPQTLEDHVLEAIGRKHSSGDIQTAYDLARKVGFDCINMDLIAGLPLDSLGGFRRSLDGVLAMGPENITVHTLAMKKGSTLIQRKGALPGGEEVAQMLDYSRTTLSGGYLPYYLYRQKYMSGSLENVGWARPGTESLYNIVMMEELHTVISLGAGGVTKLIDPQSGRLLRLSNPKYPQDYLSAGEKLAEQQREMLAFFR